MLEEKWLRRLGEVRGCGGAVAIVDEIRRVFGDGIQDDTDYWSLLARLKLLRS
jgi:hypothetical protein